MLNLFAIAVILLSASIGPQEQAGVRTVIHTSCAVASAPRADAHVSAQRKAWFSHAIDHILGGD